MNKYSKLFKKVFTTVSIVAMLLLIGVPRVNAQLNKYMGSVDVNGNPNSTVAGGINSYWGLNGYFSSERALVKYTPAELGDKPFKISQFAFYFRGYSGRTDIPNFALLYKFGEPNDVFATGMPTPNGLVGNATNVNITPDKFDASFWQSQGFTLLYGVANLNVNPITGWVTFDLPSAIEYNGNQSLHFALLNDGGNFTGGLAWHGYNETPQPAQPRMVWAAPINQSQADNGIMRVVHPMSAFTNNPYAYTRGYKYNLRVTHFYPPKVVEISPCCDNSFRNEFLPTGPEVANALTSFTFDVTNTKLHVNYPRMDCYYHIVGPYPRTDTIYKMVNPDNTEQDFISFNLTDADANNLIKYDIMRAVGPAVWTEDNKSLDFTKFELDKAGLYHATLVIKPQGTGPHYEAVIEKETFYVRNNYDVMSSEIISPVKGKDYPIGGNPIPLIATFCNNGYMPIDSFRASFAVYAFEDYDTEADTFRTKNIIARFPSDTTDYIWHANLIDGPLLAGKCVTLDERHFGSFSPSFGSYYGFEILCTFANPLINDIDTSNNRYPSIDSKANYEIRSQTEIYPCLFGDQLRGFAEPRADVTSLGRVVNIATLLYNDGLVDISEAYKIYMKTWIEDDKGDTVWPANKTPHKYIIKRGGLKEGEVRIDCVDSITGERYGWIVDRSLGTFKIHSKISWNNWEDFEESFYEDLKDPTSKYHNPPYYGRLDSAYHYDWSDKQNPPWTWVNKNSVNGQACEREVTFDFTVVPALSGSYNVGVGQHFRTINETIDSLYVRGVRGPVTFVLTDEVYNESRWTSVLRAAPALDFRSKIPGVVTTRFNSITGGFDTIINEIRYVPSYQRSNQRGSIRINLESLNGVGMWFGAADDSVTSRPGEPMVNLVPTLEKKNFNQSDGYIIWDGGINKSIRLTYNKPKNLPDELIPYLRGEEFRCPVYITCGRNITIKNCIIEDGVNQPRSKSYLLGGNYYSGSDLRFVKDYEDYIGQQNDASSAGIILRMKPPYQDRYQENRYGLDTIPCYNNTFAGNEITQFTYGIVCMGLNFKTTIYPFLIDTKDTIDISLDELIKNNDMSTAGSYVVSNPNGTTTDVRVFKQLSSVNSRSSLYYKHHTIKSIPAGLPLGTYTIIVDSAQGGIRRLFNSNNIIEDNLIYDIGRIGIFIGNDENSIVRNNRIHGITGEIEKPVGYNSATGRTIMAPADAEADCAGIYLGGRHRPDSVAVDGFMVIGTQVYKNEISNISSAKSVSGVKFEQTMLTEKVTNLDTEFPDAYERVSIYSNIIWGLLPRNNDVDRYGINLSISKKVKLEGDVNWQWTDTLYYSTARDSYFMNRVLLSNNTIIMEEDGINTSRGDYFGLKVQKLLNSRVINNAVEMLDTTFLYPNGSNKFAAAVYYQAPTIEESNNYIDYNVYAYSSNADVPVDVYRNVTTDITGVIVDDGYKNEYKTLSNWQNWMKTDLFSVASSFVNDFEKTDELFPKFRYRTNPLPVNNPLEKRGMYLVEAEIDIDGVDRTKADQRLDIGAQYLSGLRHTSDVEVLNIIDPATYYSSKGPLSDAEYFMRKDEPLKVRVLLRNNGNARLNNHPLTLRIFEESSATNNLTVNIHNNNFNNEYYNNERGHSGDVSVFPTISPTTGVAVFNLTKNVTIAPGEGHIVEFEVPANAFKTYWELSNTHTPPMQFVNMRTNVTPRYLFIANADISGDMNPNNNEFSKLARFYIKKSSKDMIVTVSNTHYPVTDLVIVSGVLTPIPKRTITNTDYVAGRLNFDTIVAGFRRIGYLNYADEQPRFDYDIIDRSVWDYRNIDYTLYKTLFYSDDLPMEEFKWEVNRYDLTKRYFQDKWLMKNLTDFLQKGTSTNKTNLIILSEEFLKDLYTANFGLLYLNRYAKDYLIHNYFRTNLVYDSLSDNGQMEYYPISPLYRKDRVSVGIPPVDVWSFVGEKYKFNNRMGAITGRTISEDVIFNIKETGWQWSEDNRTVIDADPYGLLISPVDNMVGFNIIGAIFDTLIRPRIPSLSDASRPIPDQYRIASTTQSTINNTITMVTFDWRHYAEVDKLLVGIFDFLDRNSIGSDSSHLPIALYDFDAVPVSNRVELSWNTLKESNARTFLVERANVIDSHNGSFKTIKEINVVNDAIVNNYNLTDRNLNYDTEYAYRLRIVGVSGEIKYSDILKVRTESVLFELSDISPNPVTLESEFTLSIGQAQDIHIAIYDLSGKEVLLLNNKKLLSGSYNFSINAAELVSGSYTLVIKSELQETITKQFNVVK